MRTALFTLFILLSLSSRAQTWQIIHQNDFGFDFFLVNPTDGTNYGFNISPYNNSIWLLRNDIITYIDQNGKLTDDPNVDPMLNENGATCTSIGLLDRITNTWTEYNNNNSPIDFPVPAAIELDTNGNLWVADISKLHCLQLGTALDWLATKEIVSSKFEMCPNPTTGILNIALKENLKATEISVAGY